jgi:transaldolase
MKAAAPLKLREAGQSLWLDNITRNLLTTGTLKRYIDELSITGLTSNPTIFDHAISSCSSPRRAACASASRPCSAAARST